MGYSSKNYRQDSEELSSSKQNRNKTEGLKRPHSEIESSEVYSEKDRDSPRLRHQHKRSCRSDSSTRSMSPYERRHEHEHKRHKERHNERETRREEDVVSYERKQRDRECERYRQLRERDSKERATMRERERKQRRERERHHNWDHQREQYRNRELDRQREKYRLRDQYCERKPYRDCERSQYRFYESDQFREREWNQKTERFQRQHSERERDWDFKREQYRDYDQDREQKFAIGENQEERQEQERKLFEIKSKLTEKHFETLEKIKTKLTMKTVPKVQVAEFKQPKNQTKQMRKKSELNDLLVFPEEDSREEQPKRYISHKFHTDEAGKTEIEKRLKKIETDFQLLKTKALTMLQQKQKETKRPYVVLSQG